ncbi:hypothetical protein [Metaclostridioides mangenotii]|uniref:hypothetical protein n=1 Tax=Metaclostridioides mangenotii TaxID=1540 RepID=UPI0004652DDD|nr:hypothetical protein [Clostridioides mangenotii]
MFIDKMRLIAQYNMKRNIKKEYKEAKAAIKLAANSGRTSTKYHIVLYYENRDEIYAFIMDKLKSKGFKVDIEAFGCNLSHIRLHIDWSI